MLRRPPDGVPVRGAIVHVHAFAEEMNKSRHMVALQADTWARDGWMVLQPDLLGCGDSSGAFSDAGWGDWLQDVRCAVEWLRMQGANNIWLWGLRLGALLAGEANAQFGLGCGLLLWQPVTSGKQHLQQFLRLWKMGQVVGKIAVSAEATPRERLTAGEVAEVAGYPISPALAMGMEAADMVSGPGVRAVHWFQVVSVTGVEPTAAFKRHAAGWDAAGVRATFHEVQGPSFWQTQEIELARNLLDVSSAVVARQSEWASNT